MDQSAKLAELETRAKERGVALSLACERAGIAYSTFYRWKRGTSAPWDSVIAVSSAIDDIAKERAA